MQSFIKAAAVGLIRRPGGQIEEETHPDSNARFHIEENNISVVYLVGFHSFECV